MIGPEETYHAKQVYTPEILPALRELLSQYPHLADAGPDEIRAHLHRYIPRSPEIFEVEAALEALLVEGRRVA